MNEIANIEHRIFTIRNQRVMLDRDLAEIYGYQVKRLNEQVKRNSNRFPADFMFQLTKEEEIHLKSHFATSSAEQLHGGRRKLPYAFTEQGVYMLATVLKGEIAEQQSIFIIRAFREMRKFLISNQEVFARLDRVEFKQLQHDEKFEKVFQALEEKSLKPTQGIFYDGQIFDAYAFVCDLVKIATEEIVLIDNYIDESVLQLLSKRKKGVKVLIYTMQNSKSLQQDIKKYTVQYGKIEIKKFTKSHDRFLIIDKTVYHFGASLKDLGKKWFAFSKMQIDKNEIEKRLTIKS